MDAREFLLDLQDEMNYALQGDLEHGVAWLNDRAADEFKRKYPCILSVIGKLLDWEDEESKENQ